MKSTVRIENVGPIKFAEIDLQKYMVLIGEQASGKSTIAKVVYSLTNVAEVIKLGLLQLILLTNIQQVQKIISSIKSGIADNLLGIENFDSGKVTLYYDNKEVIVYNHGEEIYFSKEFTDALISVINRLAEDTAILTNNFTNTNATVRNELFNICKQLVNNQIADPFFPPAIPFLLPNQESETAHLFLTYSEEMKPDVKNDEIWSFINNYSERVINGKFFKATSNEKEAYVLLNKENKKIEIDNLSYGQKYSLRIFNYAKHYTMLNSSDTFIIEEPETHLFPAAQSDVTKAIITFANQPEKENQVLITTHSPYVLSTINNLLYAGQLAEDERTDLEKLKSVVPEHLWMKPSDFACYKVENGELDSLVVTLDSGIKQIDQDYIDRISNVLIDEMNQLILIDPNDE